MGVAPVAGERVAERTDAPAHRSRHAGEQAVGHEAVGAQRQQPDDHDRRGERGDHDHDPGAKQRAKQDRGSNAPARHAEHAREAAACERRKHVPVADLAAHLDGAHGVAANARGKHLGEEHPLEV